MAGYSPGCRRRTPASRPAVAGRSRWGTARLGGILRPGRAGAYAHDPAARFVRGCRRVRVHGGAPVRGGAQFGPAASTGTTGGTTPPHQAAPGPCCGVAGVAAVVLVTAVQRCERGFSLLSGPAPETPGAALGEPVGGHVLIGSVWLIPPMPCAPGAYPAPARARCAPAGTAARRRRADAHRQLRRPGAAAARPPNSARRSR